MPARCSDCQQDPAQLEYWDCEGKHDEIVFKFKDIDPDDSDSFSQCPLKLVPQKCWDWFSEYKFYKDFPGSAPKFKDIQARWLEAVNEYESYYFPYTKVANGKPIDG